jgi:D-cysteine desulfhydrase family pyridoxal phosphate-dependent enzyme
MSSNSALPSALGCIASLPSIELGSGVTPLESMPNLAGNGPDLYVKRDDCNGLALGGNKVRQLAFYFGEAIAENADTILITGAVQSNFVRMTAAAARKMGMDCHIQLEDRVTPPEPAYRQSGNVLMSRMFGATLHSYPDGEDEEGADRQIQQIAADLSAEGKHPYIIPLAFGHPPLGALGYVLAAAELLRQLEQGKLSIDEIFVASGSGATHAGLLFGLRAFGSPITVTGVCVRRNAALQKPRILETCEQIALLLQTDSCVVSDDVRLTDDFLAPGYGVANAATMNAIIRSAQTEGLLLDPVYTGKAMAGVLQRAEQPEASESSLLFWHTGGVPAIFAYRETIEAALEDSAGNTEAG